MKKYLSRIAAFYLSFLLGLAMALIFRTESPPLESSPTVKVSGQARISGQAKVTSDGATGMIDSTGFIQLPSKTQPDCATAIITSNGVFKLSESDATGSIQLANDVTAIDTGLLVVGSSGLAKGTALTSDSVTALPE